MRMDFDHEIFIDGVKVNPSEIAKYTICNVAVDKIVNSIIDKVNSNSEVSKLAS